MKGIFYDRDSGTSLRNSTDYEIYAGFTYRFAPGCFLLADYWEEGNDWEHDNLPGHNETPADKTYTFFKSQ